jgi:simple sugar transport system ATP-binding protein
VTSGGRIEVRLGARQLTRQFGSVVANDRIDFSVAPGTIHAVVGGNGAGKSTLMRILQGVDSPDSGSVILDDEPVRLTGPADAYARGIGMVHQEFMLAPPLTLLENLILAREPLARSGLIDWRTARVEAARLAKIAGVEIDWSRRVADAPVHVRQILEILRLLYRGVDVLILDEPTAVLAPLQIEELLGLLRKLKAEGRTIVFISHKLEEVMSVADAITVMRAGRVVASTTPDKTSREALAQAVIGDAALEPKVGARAHAVGAPLLSARGLAGLDSMGVQRLGPLDLEIFPGEILGVAGVAGNGQDELVECIAGLTAPAAGAIAFAGKDISRASTAHFRALGVGYLSADRAEEGLCLTASIRDNYVAGRERNPAFSRLGVLRLAAIGSLAEQAMRNLSVRYGRLADPASSLSGGNQQRLAFARELGRDPKLLVASQPTRGVDIGGTAFIHAQIAALRDRGAAILLISESLDEILDLSDRIVVLYNGRLVGALRREEASVESVGRMMLGRKAA